VLHCAAALEAFGKALALHQQKKQAAVVRNEVREKKREALAAAGDDALAAQLEGSIEEDEAVPVVPAKLLNNTAVLKYRCVYVCACMRLCWLPMLWWCVCMCLRLCCEG
jgi:hypothetical protein